MEELAAETVFGEPVAVMHPGLPAGERRAQPLRAEGDPEVLRPERATPSVVIAAHHLDLDSLFDQ